jgi:hypothetical protein
MGFCCKKILLPLRERPELKGLPVVVGADPKRERDKV